MSTEIKATLKHKTVVRFWGGDKHGAMLQVTGDDGYVQFDLAEAVEIIQVFSAFASEEAKRRQELLRKKVEETKELEKTVWAEIATLEKELFDIDIKLTGISYIDTYAPKVKEKS